MGLSSNGRQVLEDEGVRFALYWYITCKFCDRDVPVPTPTFQ